MKQEISMQLRNRGNLLGKTTKVLALTVGGVLALAATLYLVAVAINWKDKEPSLTAIKFAEFYRSRTPVDDEDNAYVFVLGMGAAPGEDVLALGIKRMAWLQESQRDGKRVLKDDPAPQTYDYRSSRSPEINQLIEGCRASNSPSCAAEFEAGDQLHRGWLEKEQWLLNRYRTMLQLSAWREPPFLDAAEPFPPYQVAIDGQWLLLAKAKALAREKDVAGTRTLLEQDIRFWRRMLESSDILISKMIATVALNRHFELGNVVLRQFSPADSVQVLPAEWHAPISDSERSMLRCLVGEWVFSANVVKTMVDGGDISIEYVQDSEHDFFGKATSALTDVLGLPLFQLQDTINKSAEDLSAIAQMVDVPFDQLDGAFQQIENIGDQRADNTFLPKSVYNPVGHILLNISAPAYIPYAKRVADIEGTRRAALTAVLLRQQGVKPGQVAAQLDKIQFTNPYDNKPFVWDSKNGSVVFVGREKGERRVHAILY
jgi:hypothetical protein